MTSVGSFVMTDPPATSPGRPTLDLTRLDPHARNAVQMLTAPDKPRIETLLPEVARRIFAKGIAVVQSASPDVEEVWDCVFSGATRQVPARYYRGRLVPPAHAPCVLFFHGGGWVVGDLDSHDRLCRRLANAASCTVVSVDYAHAPEHPFPIAFDEAVRALSWLGGDGLNGRIDVGRIAVAGDSAGGNLAAALCIAAKGGNVPILHQILIYPVTDSTLSQPAHAVFTTDLPLTSGTMRWFRDHYIADPGLAADWRASPLNGDLRFCPPALVVTAGFDPLCDDGSSYAVKLAHSGVSVKWWHYADQIHGFLTLDRLIPTADIVLDAIARELRWWFEIGKDL